MENNMNKNQKRSYIKPEAGLIVLNIQENIATSNPEPIRIFRDEFDGEADEFD